MIKTDECSVPCQARQHAEYKAEYFKHHYDIVHHTLLHSANRNRQLYLHLRNAVLWNRIFITAILILLGVVVWLLFM